MSDVVTVAEHRRGELRDVSHELITAGRELADDLSGRHHLAVISGDVERFAQELNCDGVDTIHTIDRGEEFNHGVYTTAIEALYDELRPTALVMPHTVNGLDYAPAVANSLDLPLVTDVTGINAEDGVTVTREMYGSKVETDIRVDSDHWAITVRDNEWSAAEADGGADVNPFEVAIDSDTLGTQVRGFEQNKTDNIDITDAEVLVSVGRGIKSEDNIEMVEELSEALGATLSASRPIIDNGWLPKSRQVGQSGKFVTPDVYIAVGISGAVQHITGMKSAETIIAINNDPDAPIFDVADYVIVDDLFEVVPALTEKFGT